MKNDCARATVADACFALLDDRDATDADPRSRLYTSYAGTLTWDEAGGFSGAFDELQRAFAQGLQAVGLFSYEAAEQLHGIAR